MPDKFINYGKQTIEQDDIDAVVEALKSDWLTSGPGVQDFEKKISDYTGAGYTIAVSSATAALHLASLCLLAKNDQVLTTANSFLATSNSILYAGAYPLFIDIDKYGNIDLDLAEDYLKKDHSSKIRAIYAVHFSGKTPDYQKLEYLRKKYGIYILEDCAHSLGAMYRNGTKAGSSYYSDCSVLSFHPVKNITSGEGGAITTNNPDIYHRCLQLRNHGINRNSESFLNFEMAFNEDNTVKPWYYEMTELGYNYRITDIQSALGKSQLNKIDRFIIKRREIAEIYGIAFQNKKFIQALYPFDKFSAYHLFVVLIDFLGAGISRTEFMNNLKAYGIGTQVHYIPINKQPYYQKLGYGQEYLPNTRDYYLRCLSLPIYPELSSEDLQYIINKIDGILS